MTVLEITTAESARFTIGMILIAFACFQLGTWRGYKRGRRSVLEKWEAMTAEHAAKVEAEWKRRLESGGTL